MSWINSILNWWKNLFSSEKNKSEPVKEATPAVEISRTPGLNCPECGTRMVVSIQNLVNLEPLNCPTCGLELTVDVEHSQSALESLRKLQNGLEEASKIRKDAKV